MISTSTSQDRRSDRRRRRSRRRQPPRLFLAVAVMLLLCLLPELAPVRAQGLFGDSDFGGDSGEQEIVVELRVGRLSRQTVLARLEHGVVLVPARSLFELAEMRASIAPTGRLDAVRLPWGISIGVDPAYPRAWVGKEEIAPELVQTRWTGEELYLATELVEALLDLRVIVNFADLTVTLDPADKLPIGRRVARERARLVRLGPGETAEPDRVYESQAVRWHGAALDWSVQMPDLNDMSISTYQMSLGSNLMGGALDVRYRGGRLPLSTYPWAASWVRAWSDQPWLGQLHLGAVPSTGPRGRSVYGLAVTNTPYYRPMAFGETTLRGYLEPGWEVELYRDGRLTDFTMTDENGFYEFATYIEYGPNPVELRAYGPEGEMRLLERSIRVTRERLPRGRFEYEIGGGVCQTDECDGVGNLDLRYGLTRGWTIRTGLDAYVRRELGDLYHPYLMLNGSWRERVLLSAESSLDAFHSLEIGYEPTMDLRGFVNHSIYDSRDERPILAPLNQSSRTQAGLFWRPVPRLRSQFLTGSFLHTTGFEWSQTTGSIGLATQVRNVRLKGEWRSEELVGRLDRETSRVLGFSASTALHSRWLPPLRGLFMRGNVDFDIGRRELDYVNLMLSKNIGTLARVELETAWSQRTGGYSIQLGLSASRSMVRTVSRVARSPGGRITTGASFEGAVLWNDAVGRVEAQPVRSTGRGGVSGIVFLDANSNGVHDPGEDGIPFVRLIIGPFSTVTDELGRYSVWDLGPFDATKLSFDIESLPNPLWVPQVSLASVAVMPNGFHEVNLPVVRGAELSGSVMREGYNGWVGVAGIRIELTHVGSGRHFETLTFHDGAFYFMALPPGDYEVVIPQDLLDHLGLVLEDQPRRIHVERTDDWSSPNELTLELHTQDIW